MTTTDRETMAQDPSVINECQNLVLIGSVCGAARPNSRLSSVGTLVLKRVILDECLLVDVGQREGAFIDGKCELERDR
jgi:hypothetical protein